MVAAKQQAVREALMEAVESAAKYPTDERRPHVLGWIMGAAGLSDDEAAELQRRLGDGDES